MAKKKSPRRGYVLYSAYVFKDKDPAIDAIRTVMQDHFGKRNLSHEDYDRLLRQGVVRGQDQAPAECHARGGRPCPGLSQGMGARQRQTTEAEVTYVPSAYIRKIGDQFWILLTTPVGIDVRLFSPYINHQTAENAANILGFKVIEPPKGDKL
jgi:hypothetical protein